MDLLARILDSVLDMTIYILVFLCVATLWFRFVALPLTSEHMERQAALDQDSVVSDTVLTGFDDSTPCVIDPWHPMRSPCSSVYWAKDLEDDISR